MSIYLLSGVMVLSTLGDLKGMDVNLFTLSFISKYLLFSFYCGPGSVRL